MKRSLVLVFMLCVPFLQAQLLPGDNLVVRGVPPIPVQLAERTNQYLNVRAAAFRDWDRAGKGLYITTRFGNTAQVHVVDSPGAARRQLTFFDEPIGSVLSDPRPGRDGFLFSKDLGGNEFYQLYMFNRTQGTWRLLTDGVSRNESPAWSHGGRFISYASNKRNKKDTDVWIMDPDAPENAWNVTEREGAWYPGAWSFDDRYLIVAQFVSANETRPHVVDLTEKSIAPLFPANKPRASFSNFEWSKDGKTIYYVSDEGGDFKHVYSFDRASGASKDMTPALQSDIEGLAISRNGAWLAYITNEDGRSALHLHTFPAMKEVRLAGLPVGIISGLEFDDRSERLALTVNAATSPGDVYSVDLASNRIDRWTNSEVGGLDTRSFIAPELVRYPTFDSLQDKPRLIPAFVYRPKGREGKAPVVINIHGGPEGQSRPGFNPTFQFWLNELNCVVIDPNVRGSSGYGKAYLESDNFKNREHSVRDIGALLDWIATQPDMDPTRVAVIGGSYGGYMVLASLVHFSERIRCGVDNVGISNFVTFLENTESYRRDLRRVEYGDERDPDMRAFLQSISPLSNAGRIRSPLFVVQGENDPRVPASEARQIVTAVEKNGVDVWSLFAKDEGHGFAKKHNRDYYSRAVILFFEKFLLQK